MRLADNMDDRGWCRACYQLDQVNEHADCCCVCHGRRAMHLADTTRARSWALVFAQEIERSARATRKILTGVK